jgi:hypothetical protein
LGGLAALKHCRLILINKLNAAVTVGHIDMNGCRPFSTLCMPFQPARRMALLIQHLRKIAGYVQFDEVTIEVDAIKR